MGGGETVTNAKRANSCSRGNESTKKPKKEYQTLTPREHILLRPDMYGATRQKEEHDMHILNNDTGKFEPKTLIFASGLCKIFDEALQNSLDASREDSTVTTLNVTIDTSKPTITVANNGTSIANTVADDGVQIIQKIFGTLLTSSNYDDDVKRIGGGKNEPHKGDCERALFCL